MPPAGHLIHSFFPRLHSANGNCTPTTCQARFWADTLYGTTAASPDAHGLRDRSWRVSIPAGFLRNRHLDDWLGWTDGSGVLLASYTRGEAWEGRESPLKTLFISRVVTNAK